MSISWSRRLCSGGRASISNRRSKGRKTGRDDWLRCVGCDRSCCVCRCSSYPRGWCGFIFALYINKGIPQGITGDGYADQSQKYNLQALLFLIGSAHKYIIKEVLKLNTSLQIT